MIGFFQDGRDGWLWHVSFGQFGLWQNSYGDLFKMTENQIREKMKKQERTIKEAHKKYKNLDEAIKKAKEIKEWVNI